MRGVDDLCGVLKRIDGRGYKAYREIQAEFEVRDFKLFIDHVQGDPYASPSKLRWRLPQTKAAVPATLFDNPVRRMALEDWLARRVRDSIRKRGGDVRDRRGPGRNGTMTTRASAG